jgi:hypothetical protein
MRILFSATIVLFLGLVLVSGCSREEATPSVTAPLGENLALGGNGRPQWFTWGWQLDGDRILQLDTRTGLGTLGARVDHTPALGAFGIAFDLDGTCYAFESFYNGENASYLARVDIQTGIVTPINIDAPYDLIFAGPDIDSHGNLYVTGFTVGPPEDPENPAWWGGYDLWRVNKATGELTLVGDTQIGTGGEYAGEWMDLAFDSQDRCWTTCRNKLFLLDTTDGHSTYVCDITNVPTEYIPDDECPDDWQYMEIMDIAFDDHDVLWGSAIRGFSPCTGFKNSPVMRIDVNTGEGTLIGYAHTGGQNHGGDIVPTKVTVAHRKGNGRYTLIDINMNALAAHLAHGDYVPGTVGDPNYPAN